MHRRAALAVMLVLAWWGHPRLAGLSEAGQPAPLTCGKDDKDHCDDRDHKNHKDKKRKDKDRHDRDCDRDHRGRDHDRHCRNDHDRDHDRDDHGHKGGKVCPKPHQCQVRTSNQCVKGECPPIVNAPDGTRCDDGNGSTTGDVCTRGVCGGGPSTCPEDGNPCTTEVRQADGTCTSVNVANGTICNDGQACTTSDVCTQGVCEGAPVQCGNTNNPCTVSVCLASGSCGTVNVADGTVCSDGNACTSGDACTNGVCGGAPVQCTDDGNPCTVSACQADGSCGPVNVADGTACGGGDSCTTGGTCQAGVCGAGTPIACSSPTDTCDPSSGCATQCGPGGCFVAGTGVGNPTLTIPPNALSADVRIRVTDLGSDPSNPSVFHVYDLGPDGTQFATPATIDLPAPPLAPGHTVVIEVTSGTGWVAIPTTLNAGRVSGPISHFSQCRTRDVAPTANAELIMVDMVEFQDVDNLLTPIPGCTPPPSSFFGVCLTVKNPGGTTIPSATLNIFGWQCYNRGFDIEGERCLPGLLFSCGSTVAAGGVPVPLPPGGLAPGAETTFQLPFEGPGAIPLGFCFDGSAFVGVDVVFREPTTMNDPAGIRSAKDGPFVNGALFQGIYPLIKAGNAGPIKNFLIDARF